ncbi:putative C-S lyase [Helicobacter saguini]|uniref:cysteine-S-conjugate beta-lyase n=1 Tax=Helicobacter saguini TaxID=1548018 RepID=A0A347VXJ1_9HELI|nr:MalY/PatB family protein [Helicobacter saguini]MWV61613.1 putative C-S lyase [Helicobacter saguini]MWV67715.1 putative C-S lyase [Helicobacter saguini]MWV70067.1 putative C-S lyase [Helicobacter saguini]MWV72720.1 putative C-S lyase [Helicobacter saguini]TLD92016.1 pyridoxal phosphate-dependent aminotransferase [Helicobacter saguini]
MYDFSSVVNRRFGENALQDSKDISPNFSLKWNVGKDELPAWVADMDFKIAPEITQGLQELVNHGIFGYSVIPSEYYESIISWWERRYNLKMDKKSLIFACGVVPAIASIIRAKSKKGDKILIQPPVYHVFSRVIKENGRQIAENPLVYSDGKYSIDFADLDSKLRDSSTKIMLLCNPHNPSGNVWSADELREIGRLCHKHGVLVISDEIHCDITFGVRYTPFASVNATCRDISVSTFSPSKSFNVADLHTAFVMVDNESLRRELRHCFAVEYVNNPNAFGLKASILAYSKGEAWLDSLLQILQENRKIVSDFIASEIKELYVVPQDSTYLMWIDCSKITDNTDSFCESLRKNTGLYVSCGSQFGGNGAKFFRLNIATPKTTLMDILGRLKNGVRIYLDSKD